MTTKAALQTSFITSKILQVSKMTRTRPSTFPSSMPSSSPSLVPFYLEMNGTSVIIEDIEMPIGNAIQWTLAESPIPTVISKIVLKNIPAGTTIKYTHPVEGLKEWVSVGVASELELPGQAEVDFWNVLDTLTILAAPQSDENFEIVIQVTTECYN